MKNERISRSGGFQACYEIIRGVGGWSESWSESRPESQYNSVSTSELLNPTPWEKCPTLVGWLLAAWLLVAAGPRSCQLGQPRVAYAVVLQHAARPDGARWARDP
jgi:hypothetical protein